MRWISTRESFRWGSLDCVFDKSVSWETEDTVATMEMVRQSLLQSRPEQIAAFVSWMSHTSILHELARIDVPVLNIAGARAPVVPPVHQIHLSGRLARVSTIILDRVGHLAMAEARDQVDRLVRDFMHSGVARAPRVQTISAENLSSSHGLVFELPR